jgi:hypothetical protein
MADELPEPKSRKESYLAKAAGMDVTIPEKPLSRLEQYLDAIAEGGGGGGGSYTAGDGIDIANNTISVDTDTIQEKLTAGTGIDITDNTISATGGGGGDTVYSDKNTSDSATGGAVYIGNLDASQAEQADPTTTDNHYRYFYALPYENPLSAAAPKNGSINILGVCKGESSVILGFGAYDTGNAYYPIVIGQGAHGLQSSVIAMGLNAGVSAQNSIAIGRNAIVDATQNQNSVALGSFAIAARRGEVNIGTGGNNLGYNNTDYRVIGGVHDGQLAQDAVTVSQVNSVIDAINTALSTNIPHIGA